MVLFNSLSYVKMIFIIPSDYRGIFNIVLYDLLYHHIFILDKIEVMAVAYGMIFVLLLKSFCIFDLFGKQDHSST